MRMIAAVSLTALALAGCNKATVNETNASVEEVANAVAEAKTAIKLQPGRWESSSELVALDAPGMPPQAQEMMKKQMSLHGQRIAICLRPEDVEKPNAGFFGQTSKDCRFDHYRMEGGTIDAKLSCAPPQSGGTVTTEMKGSYASDRYEMQMTSDMKGIGQPMKMTLKMVSTRVGACTGDEIKAAPRPRA